MALVKCKECGKSISDSAKACPECGAKPPKKTSFVTKLVAGIIGIGVVMSIIGNIQSSKEQDQKAKAEAARLASLTPEQRAAEEKAKAKPAQDEADRKRLEDQQWKNTMVAIPTPYSGSRSAPTTAARSCAPSTGLATASAV